MMSNKGDAQKRIVCPYEPSHIILAHRLQTHLVKCRRQHPNNKMVDCINNATHQVPEPELACHLEICSDRAGMDSFMHAQQTTSDEKYPPLKLNLPCSENWDDEPCPTYNPEEHCVNNEILRNKNTLSQAARKEFRFAERQRMQKFQAKKTEEIPKELQQQPPKETGQNQVRRPNTVSAGVFNKGHVEEDDVSELLDKIKLGRDTATIPKMNLNGITQQQPASSQESNLNGESDPTTEISENEANSFATQMQGVNNTVPEKKTRGRGRGLAQS